MRNKMRKYFLFPKKGCVIHKQSITNYRYTFEIEVRKSESESGTWKIKVYLAPALRVQCAFLMLRVAIKFKCRHASHQM